MKHKKIIIAGLLGSVVLLGLFAFWWFRPGIAIEKVLPQGPVAFVRLAHGTTLWNEFSSSHFYQQLKSVDLTKVLKHNNVPQDRIDQVAQVQKQWNMLVSNPWVKRVLGKEVVLALYPDQVKGFYPVVVIRLDHTLQTAQVLSQMMTFEESDFTLTSDLFEGEQIFHVSLNKTKEHFYYVRYQDVLVIVPQEVSGLKAVIKAQHKAKLTLSDDPHWVFAHNQGYKVSDVDFFVLPYPLMEALSSGKAIQGEAFINQIKAIKTLAISFNHDQASHFKFSVDLDKNLTASDTIKSLTCPQDVDEKAMSLVPASVIAYNWGNCYDFSSFWKNIKEHLGAYPVFEKGLRQYNKAIKRHFGLDVENDVLPLMGNEVGGYMTDIDTKAVFPYPRFLIFIKLTNASKAQQLLASLKERLPVTLQKEQYQSTEIQYMDVSLGSNTDPSYCVLGDYLLVASTRQLLKKSIDTFALPERALSGDKIVAQLGLNDGQVTNTVMLLRTADVVKRMKSLLNWADRFLASQVSMGTVYKSEWETRQNDFDSLINEKTEEMVVASERLKEIKSLSDPSLDSSNSQEELITTDIDRIKADIDDLKSKKVEGAQLLKRYQSQAKVAKLMMFNASNVVVPILNAFETIAAQSVRTTIKPDLLQTEVVIK